MPIASPASGWLPSPPWSTDPRLAGWRTNNVIRSTPWRPRRASQARSLRTVLPKVSRPGCEHRKTWLYRCAGNRQRAARVQLPCTPRSGRWCSSPAGAVTEAVALRRERSDGVGPIGVGRDDRGLTGAYRAGRPTAQPRLRTQRGRWPPASSRRTFPQSPPRWRDTIATTCTPAARAAAMTSGVALSAPEAQPQMHRQSWTVLVVIFAGLAARGRQSRRGPRGAALPAFHVPGSDGTAHG